MSNSPTAPTSTTASSSNSSSRKRPRGGSPDERAPAGTGRPRGGSPDARAPAGTAAQPATIIACGALAKTVRQIAARRGWNVLVRPVPASFHNNPRHIVGAVERLATAAASAGHRVALAYADCGSYGELDRLCARLGMARLGGLHCFDVFAGPDRVRAVLRAEPGTYLLTDYLVQTFRRSVLVPLGLEDHPELWPDYFAHYRRLVWLTQAARDPALAASADAIAARFGLPMTVVETGTVRLERELETLLEDQA